MLRCVCTKMNKCHASFIVSFGLQACVIVALYWYGVPLGRILHAQPFLKASNRDTVSRLVNVFSTSFSSKQYLVHTGAEDFDNGSQIDITSNYTKHEANMLNSNKFLICQMPTGRLGNQMFDFASALGIAHALKYKFIMPSSHPLLKYFEINQTLGERLENVKKIPIIAWRKNTWNKTILLHNITLQNCWRNWKNFDSISDGIRKSFTVRPKFLTLAKEFIQSKRPENVTLIGVHVRRGDFLSQREQQKGRIVVNKEYLLKAMNWFRRQYADARFIVVSNDMRWCKTNIPGNDVFFSMFTEPIIDMAILSLCNHTVISTGTFGWWGAWLAGGKVVYCSDYPRPGSYVAKHSLFREDFYPPSWIGMTNGN